MSGKQTMQTAYLARHCHEETPEPVHGISVGELPRWLRGDLFRCGPAGFEVGDTKYNHLFDGLSMIYRFRIENGEVTYFKKFLRSDTYNANMAAKRIVISEFGTTAFPDPCKTLYQRFMSYFTSKIDTKTDNCSVSIAPYGDKLYAVSEIRYLREVDPETLDSPEKLDVTKFVAASHATAHPQIEADGTIYNMGNSYGRCAKYCILKFPPNKTGSEGSKSTFEQAKIVATIPSTWRFHPSYYHSFAMTKNYFVFVEQSVVVSLPKAMPARLFGQSVHHALQWHPDRQARFFVVEKSSGKVLDQVYITPHALFFFHHVNAYEQDDHIVMDLVAYKDGLFSTQLELKQLRNPNNDDCPLYDSQAWRYVIPLRTPKTRWSNAENLVTLGNTTCTATLLHDGSVVCKGEILADVYGELPRINYKYNGKPYRYIYQSVTVKDNPNLSGIDKIDCHTKSHIRWPWNDCFALEPVFVASPDAVEEDDGVILTSALKREDPGSLTFVVLNAKDMSVISSTEFHTDGANGLNFHGLFAQRGQKQLFY